MRTLMITGDQQFGPGHPRYELQHRAVEKLEVVYWGWDSLWPKIPRSSFSAQGGPASGWDVVTVQDPFWRGLTAWLIARRLGARLNLQIHTDLSAQSLPRRTVAKFLLRHADSVRVVSEKIKEQVLQMGIQVPIQVLPIYIDGERFRSIVRRPHTQKTILWLGRFEREKDPLLALSILKEVRTQVDAKLVMLGSGSLGQTLRSQATRLPVEFPGWQDPTTYLATTDVVLSTSKHESFGASIVEALAAGVPVVAPDVGIVKEAGAIVVPREKLAETTVEVLQKNVRGELKLRLLSKEEWAQKWKESLL